MRFAPLKLNNIKSLKLQTGHKDVYAFYNSLTEYGSLKGIICLLEISNSPKPISVRPHENIMSEKVNRYFTDFEERGIQDTPILFGYNTYENLPDLASLPGIECSQDLMHKPTEPTLSSIHIIPDDKSKIKPYLNKINEVFLLDGHHRYEAAQSLARKNGSQAIVVMLVAKGRLFLDAFHRIIKLPDLSDQKILNLLETDYRIELVPTSYIPRTHNYFGMKLADKWYKLEHKSKETGARCDSQDLNKNVLEKIFNLMGKSNVEYINTRDLQKISGKIEADKTIFTLSPVPMNEFLSTAENSRFFPPHTTCFLPKPSTNCFVYSLSQGIRI